MSAILVTGAGGMVGQAVLAALTARGHTVHAVGRKPVRESPGVYWYTLDLMDRGASHALLAQLKPEGLLHLAWETTQGLYWHSPTNLEWQAASLTLLHDFADAGGRRAVCLGSSAEYAWGGADPLDERMTPLTPDTLYGVARNSLRATLETWAPRAGIELAWARLFNVFGPGENPVRLLPKVIRILASGAELPFDQGLLVRDFLHAEECGAALAALYDSSVCGAINVASGEAVTVRSVLSTIAAHLGALDRLHFGAQPDAPNQAERITAAVDRLRQEVQWRPAHSFEHHLHATCDWWRAQQT